MPNAAKPEWQEEKERILEALAEKDVTLQDLRSKLDLISAQRDQAMQEEARQRFRSFHRAFRGLVVQQVNNDVLRRELVEETRRRYEIEQSIFWRVSGPLRKSLTKHPGAMRKFRRAAQLVIWTLKGKIFRELRKAGGSAGAKGPKIHEIRGNGIPKKLSPEKERRLLEAAQVPPSNPAMPEAGKLSPTFSVVMPSYNTPENYLEEVVESLINQTYPRWELCLCDDGSTAEGRTAFLQKLADLDSRVRVNAAGENLGITGASQISAEMAKGEYLVIVDSDDALAPGAMSAVVEALRNNPDADYIYTDHAMMQADGALTFASLKREWSPEFFLSTNYIVHLKVVKKTTFDKIGGFVGTNNLITDLELTIRLMSAKAKIVYLPQICYFWRISESSVADSPTRKPEIHNQAMAALNRYFEDQSIAARITFPPQLQYFGVGIYKLDFPRKPVKKPAIVVPIRMGWVVDEGFFDTLLSTEIDPLPEIHFISLDHKPTSAARPGTFIHHAPTQADFDAVIRKIDAEALVFVSDAARFISATWLWEILGYLAVSPQVGAVGGAVLNGWLGIEGGGVRLLPGLPTMYKGETATEPGFWFENALGSNVEAVSSLLMATPKAVYEEVGGLPVHEYGDGAGIAYGLRLKRAGYRTVLNPWSKISTFRSIQPPDDLEERLAAEFGHDFLKDRYYHPEFDGGTP